MRGPSLSVMADMHAHIWLTTCRFHANAKRLRHAYYVFSARRVCMAQDVDIAMRHQVLMIFMGMLRLTASCKRPSSA